MKKIYSLFAIFLLPILTLAQGNGTTEPWKLGHWLSPEEMLRKGEVGKNFVETTPPDGPIRNVAEFDRMQGALVRYPFGIPIALIKEMAENIMVTTIVLNSSQQNTVTQQYQNAGVNLANCNFLLAPTDSYWTRDYGPWFESDSLNNIGIIDFPYNRPRPNDDEIPKRVAEMLNIPWFGMNVIHTGGNYMTEGMGMSSSTDLVWTENPSQTHDQVAQKVHDYLGIDNYMVEPDPNGTYIDHIDCWGKFLGPDKILIRKVPSSHPQYDEIEATAAFYASQNCSYGYPYHVFRVMTPQDQPYTNSIILNNKALVPIMNSAYDDSALLVYQAAMPGYEVLGFIGNPSTPWESTDALHCRVMGLADIGQLYIKHIPISGNQPAEYDYPLSADIIACSDSAIYNDSVLLYYKVNNGPYIAKVMTDTPGTHYTSLIPKQPGGSVVKYYLYAADHSGRHTTQPIMGSADPFTFNTVNTDITSIPDTLWYHTYQECIEGKVTMLHNFTTAGINLNSLEETGIPVGGGCMWYVDPLPVTSFPHMLNAGDSLPVRVKFTFPTDYSIPGYVLDTMHYETEIGSHGVILLINDSLLTAIRDAHVRQGEISLINYPNPFTSSTSIRFSLDQQSAVSLEIFDVRGNHIKSLVNGEFEAGVYSFEWNGSDGYDANVPSGVYFYRLLSNGNSVTKRMTLIR